MPFCGLPIKLSNAQRQEQNFSSSPCKNCSRNESTMGQERGKDSTCLDGKEEGRNYRCRKKEAFAAYESTLGGTQKSKRKEINSAQQGFSQTWAASIG